MNYRIVLVVFICVFLLASVSLPAFSGVVDVFGRSSSPYHSFSASSGRFIVLGSVNDAWGVIKAYGGVVSSVFSVFNGF
ncbi:MAG: hypothetical protein QXR22_02350, partial [Acidilobaceae archaeon]